METGSKNKQGYEGIVNIFEDSLVLFGQSFLSHTCGFSLICCLGARRTSVWTGPSVPQTPLQRSLSTPCRSSGNCGWTVKVLGGSHFIPTLSAVKHYRRNTKVQPKIQSDNHAQLRTQHTLPATGSKQPHPSQVILKNKVHWRR